MTTFPTNIKFKSVLVGTDVNVVSNVEALSGKREIITGEITKQTISLSTTPLSETEDRQFNVFLNNIKYFGSFNMAISDKSVFKPIKSDTYDSVDIVDATTINKTQIQIEKATGDQCIFTGSYVQFDNTITNNNDKKLYQITNVTNDFINVGGVDRYTLTFNTPIKANKTNGDKLYYDNLVGNFVIENGNVNKATSVLGSTGEQYVTYRLNLTEVL